MVKAENDGGQRMSILKQWGKPVLIVSALFLVAWLLPRVPVDPWNVFSVKKAAHMVFALAFVQALGSVTVQFLGHRRGAILTGFFGGLISSTATTVSLARSSTEVDKDGAGKEALTFLAATLAMLFEASVLVVFGTTDVHYTLLLIFAGPVTVTVLIIVVLARNLPHRETTGTQLQLEILPILKVAAFIIVILAVSKLLQQAFGTSGLLLLTFLVSLFEIHGSVIANIQMHDSAAFSIEFLGGLLAISVFASYLSKLFLIYTLGSSALFSRGLKYTALLVLSLAIGWLMFFLFFT